MLAIAAVRVPRGIICLLSALQYYEMTTQVPQSIWIAIENHVHQPQISEIPIQFVWLSGKSLSAGVKTVLVDRVRVKIYNPAKTVVDCFKFRNKIGLDIAQEALRVGWQTKRFTMDEIWKYAKSSRMAKVMRPYLESLI